MRSVAAILLLIAIVAGAASARKFKEPPVADMPEDTRGPTLARFAVLVYCLNMNTKLTYVDVSGMRQHPDKGGVRYDMVVTAANATGATGQYNAAVWGVHKTDLWMLLEFKRTD